MRQTFDAPLLTKYDFLPVSREDMTDRGWYYYDFLLVSGDAYVDHPSFGAAVIGRLLEAEGFRVAILAQPEFHDSSAIEAMGKPRYAALVTAGNLDSMVAHFTAAKKPRSEDSYSPGKKAGKRPNRAVTVYTQLIREAFPELFIIIGGLEASLRRFAHYDYWDDKVCRPILFDSGADLLVYGMGETATVELAHRLAGVKGKRGNKLHKSGNVKRDTVNEARISSIANNIDNTDIMENTDIADNIDIKDIRGIGYIAENISVCAFPHVSCASFEEVSADKTKYARAAMIQYDEHDPVRGQAIAQRCSGRTLIINPPALPLTSAQLDRVYSLPFTREPHPMYTDLGGVPAIDEMRFSITHNRGCFGGCSFCSLAFHQGRLVTSRSHESVVGEAQQIVLHPLFKGYIHDVGGPTANFRKPSCEKQLTEGMCKRNCLAPEPCPNVEADHSDYLQLLKKLAAIPGIKKVFIRSGIRFDYLMLDKDGEFFAQLVKNHISGQLKVAPEHCSDNVLFYMSKPRNAVFDSFREKYAKLNERYGKEQYLVPYLISSHPGSTIDDAIKLAEYLNKNRIHPEQVQEFYPTPGTLSTCMYYTGIDPRTMKPVYVPRSREEKSAQRALLQWRRPENRSLIRRTLQKAGRADLIGFGKHCLIRPENRK